jgi:hypothetical protein
VLIHSDLPTYPPSAELLSILLSLWRCMTPCLQLANRETACNTPHLKNCPKAFIPAYTADPAVYEDIGPQCIEITDCPLIELLKRFERLELLERVNLLLVSLGER